MAESGVGLHGLWEGLPKRGKVGLLAVPAVVLFALLLGGCGHSSSWQYGHDQGRQIGAELVSKGFSPESACRSVARGFDPQANMNQDAYAGCLAALK
ncbi:MAG: hypothetical protein ACOYEV_14705 [Candidatus Nanopelagicales bacterium]